jgi:hypothetical protein
VRGPDILAAPEFSAAAMRESELPLDDTNRDIRD